MALREALNVARPLFLCTGLVCAVAAADFSRDVHPILAERCFGCHGGDKRSGGLSLRDYTEALKGGLDGPVILPGRSAESLLMRRITAATSPMPPVGPRLTGEQIATIRAWIDDGARETAQGPPAAMPWTPQLALRKPEVPPVQPGASEHPVDRFVAAYLRQRGLTMPDAVSDRAFARRTYLDIWGLLPMPDQLEAFINNTEPDKRAKLIATLLGDNRNYAQHGMSFWNDLLRNDEGVNYAGTRKTITQWLNGALNANLPYDQFVEKLLNPVEKSDPDGFLLGVNWRGDINASQTPLMQAAQNSAQIFLGINLKCNSCHDSFISRWKLRDAYGLAAFFAESGQLELVRCDSATGQLTGARFLYPELDLPQPPDSPAERKAAAARMFIDPRNGRTPRTIVNRTWARLLGAGLVADVDDMDGRPWSPELLDWLAADFVEHGYDLKHLIATIMTSQAYQLPAVTRAAKEVKDYVFRGPEVRRLTAEEFSDALSAVTGEWPVHPPAQRVPAKYLREWQMPSTSLTRALGRPIRDQVFTERNQDATTLQALELVNGDVLRHRLSRGVKRMLNQLPPAPLNLFDSGRVGKDTVEVDADITGAEELRLMVADQGSYSPERVAAVWANAVLVGRKGETPLGSLRPTIGQVSVAKATLKAKVNKRALVVGVPTELIYDIRGAGYTRLRATVGVDDQSIKDDISPAVRFFVFKDKPDPERLVQLNPETPAPSLRVRPAKDGLIAALFEYMLGRPPSAQERKLAADSLSSGADIQAESLADLIWAIAMQPEFQLIY